MNLGCSLLVALQSYFHPANLNNSSEGLHIFISNLTTQFINRVHVERHNTKWVCKTKPEKRLTDSDIKVAIQQNTNALLWIHYDISVSWSHQEFMILYFF